MSRDDQPPRDSDARGPDPRGGSPRGGNFVSDLRDTVGKRVSANEGSIRDRLGKAARWVDQRTGGKYSAQIGRAESAVGDGVGRLAAQDRPAGSAGPAARPAEAGFAGSDAPTPPEGTRTPGARPDDVRDDAPTGPIPPMAAAPGAAAGGAAAGTDPDAAPGTTPAGLTEPLVDPAGPTGATERLRPGATEPLHPGATEPLHPAVDADDLRPPHRRPPGTA